MANKPKEGIVVIHGKEYKTVALRVHEFHEKYGQDYGILTDLITHDNVRVVVKASIVAKETGNVCATGHGEEFRGAGMINRTSAMENAETSAIGRALASFGLAGSEFASANEVQNAIAQQAKKATSAQVRVIEGYLKNGQLKPHHLEQRFGHSNVKDLLEVEATRIINAMKPQTTQE